MEHEVQYADWKKTARILLLIGVCIGLVTAALLSHGIEQTVFISALVIVFATVLVMSYLEDRKRVVREKNKPIRSTR